MNLSIALRSLLWTILLPGVVAGYVPWRWLGLDRVQVNAIDVRQIAGLVAIAAGAALLGLCVFEFARTGRGTLSPLDPPRRLVVRGLYRYVRNPMYLAVTMALLGEALLAGSRSLALYWAVWFFCVNLFVMLYEEPELERQFGREYAAYRARVGRWIPRRPVATPTNAEIGR